MDGKGGGLMAMAQPPAHWQQCAADPLCKAGAPTSRHPAGWAREGSPQLKRRCPPILLPAPEAGCTRGPLRLGAGPGPAARGRARGGTRPGLGDGGAVGAGGAAVPRAAAAVGLQE